MSVQHNRRQRLVQLASLTLVAYWVAMFIGTHIPMPPPALDPGNNDKYVHFGACFGLAVLLSLNSFLRLRMRFGVYVRVLLILAIYGALDELTQIPVGRSCDIYDWLADVGGAMLGVVVSYALVRLATRE